MFFHVHFFIRLIHLFKMYHSFKMSDQSRKFWAIKNPKWCGTPCTNRLSPPSHRPSPAPLMTMFQSVTFIRKRTGGRRGGDFLQVSLYIVVWVVSPYLALLNYANLRICWGQFLNIQSLTCLRLHKNIRCKSYFKLYPRQVCV